MLSDLRPLRTRQGYERMSLGICLIRRNKYFKQRAPQTLLRISLGRNGTSDARFPVMALGTHRKRDISKSGTQL